MEPEALQRWARAWSEVFDFELAVPEGGAAELGEDALQRASVDESTKKKRKESPGRSSGEAAVTTDVLMQGLLTMMRKGKAELRYCVLYNTRFEYFTTVEDMTSGAQPRGRVLLSDVKDISISDTGFDVALE